MTRLERFLKDRKIKPAHLAAESGYSRQHLLRIRMGRMEPTRSCIAAIVSAAARLTKSDVRPEELFVLTLHETGAWEQRRELARKAAVERKRELEAAQRLIGRLERDGVPFAQWLREIESTTGPTEAVATALFERGRTLTYESSRNAAQVHELAIAVAAKLPHDTAAVVSVHGRAHMGRGNALANLSEYDAAFHAFDEAESMLTRSSSCLRELAEVWYSRARTLVRRTGYDDAVLWARRAHAVFSAVNDERMAALARLLEGTVLYERGDPAAAEVLFRATIDPLERAKDRIGVAFAWLDIGRCNIDLGDARAARFFLEKARFAFSKLGARSEVVRARWCLGWLVALHEDPMRGVEVLYTIRREYEELAMPTEAALVGLDIVEVLLLSGHGDAAAQSALVCRLIIDSFENRGESANARRAIAYLREAVQRDRADRELVRDLKLYLRRWHDDPSEVYEPRSSTEARNA